jgi:tetratricopeptide (TPR) repeat protein
MGEFRAVGAMRPGDIEAINGMGLIHRRQGRFSDALAAGHRVTELDPRRPARLVDLGDTYRMLRRWRDAKALYQRGQILDPTYDPAYWNRWWLVTWGEADTAGARRLLANGPAGFDATLRLVGTTVVERLARHYDASDSAIVQVDLPRLTWPLERLTWLALNNHAAGRRARAATLADSLRREAQRLLRDRPPLEAFGNLADIYTMLGIAEAVLGHAVEAVAAGDRAVSLNPVSRDAIEGPRSFDGLITIHLLLGHADDVMRLLREQAARSASSQSLIPTTRAALQLDPQYDAIRSDPRFQSLLRDDQAWVVKE